jgi:hypothetical protein
MAVITNVNVRFDSVCDSGLRVGFCAVDDAEVFDFVDISVFLKNVRRP